MIFGPDHVGDDRVSVEEVPIANAPLIGLHLVIYVGFALALLPVDQGMPLVLASGLAVLLVAISVIDIKRFEIPDTLSALLFIFGLLALWPMSPEMRLDRVIAGVGLPLLLWLVAAGFASLGGYQGLGYLYDNVSRLTQTTDPEGFVKSFAYDVRDNIQTVTDGRGGLTQFGYDPLDRMTTRTNPINQTMTRAYDGRDNLTTLTREDGAMETATYDGLKRRTQVVTPDNTLTYAYDARSNLTEAADDDSRVTFTYDVRNRLETTTTDGTVGPQPQVTLTYTYDELDRRTSMPDSLGGTTSYAWDPEDRLTDLTAPWGTVYSFGYDGEGRRTSLTSTSGRNSTYGYTNGLLTALSHAQSDNRYQLSY